MPYDAETIKNSKLERITPWWVKTLDESSEEELFQYVMKKKNIDVRLAALRRINSLEILSQLEHDLNENHEYSLSGDARSRRVNLTIDPSWRTDPEVWKLANPEYNPNLKNAQLSAVDAITDAKALQNVVMNAPSSFVKWHAAKKIADHQELLIEITRNSPDKEARKIAAEYLTDRDELRRLAIEDPADVVRREALKKTDEPELIDRALREDESLLVRRCAIAKTEDSALLLKKIDEGCSPDEEDAILERLTQISPLSAVEPLLKRYEPEMISSNRAEFLRILMIRIFRSVDDPAVRRRISPTDENRWQEWDECGVHTDILYKFK